MTAFMGLLKKDWILGRKNLAFAGILQLLVVFIAYVFSAYYDEPSLLFLSGFLIVIFHGFNFTLLLLLFLNMEGKSQLWLYNPNSSWMLLGAKMTISLIFQIISVLMACILSYIILHFLPDLFDYPPIKNIPGIGNLLLMSVSVTVPGAMLGCFVMFLWAIFHSLKQVRYIKNIRGFSVILIIIVIGGSWNYFLSTPFMTRMQEKTMIRIGTVSEFEVSTASGLQFNTVYNEVSIWVTFLHILAFVLLFCVSTRLLDRKVEV